MMHRAGLRAMSFGVESVSPATLKKVGRRPIPETHQRAILAHCRELGIVTAAFYVLGFGEDTLGVDQRDDRILGASSGSTVAQFKILTPYPGTPLYKRMEPTVTETRLGAVRRLHADLRPSEPDARRAALSARQRVYAVLRAAVVSRQLPADQHAASAAAGQVAGCARRAVARPARAHTHGAIAVMLNAISRYGPRVIPNTMQLFEELERQGSAHRWPAHRRVREGVRRAPR